MIQKCHILLSWAIVLLFAFTSDAQTFPFPRPCRSGAGKNVPPSRFPGSGQIFGEYALDGGDFISLGSGTLGRYSPFREEPVWNFTGYKTWNETLIGPYLIGQTPEGDPVAWYGPYDVPSDFPLTAIQLDQNSGEIVMQQNLTLPNHRTFYLNFGVSADGLWAIGIDQNKMEVVSLKSESALVPPGTKIEIDLSQFLSPNTQLNWPMQAIPVVSPDEEQVYDIIWTQDSSVTCIRAQFQPGNGTVVARWKGGVRGKSVLSTAISLDYSTVVFAGWDVSASKCHYDAYSIKTGGFLWGDSIYNDHGQCSSMTFDPVTNYLLITPSGRGMAAIDLSGGYLAWNHTYLDSPWTHVWGPNSDVVVGCHTKADPNHAIKAVNVTVWAPMFTPYETLTPIIVFIVDPYSGYELDRWSPRNFREYDDVYFKHLRANSDGMYIWLSTSDESVSTTNFYIDWTSINPDAIKAN